MSQARGRYSGSRDKGPRQQRQPSKTTSHRKNKPYGKPPPPQEAAQTASIFKTRSFRFLVDKVGAENIALGLDSNLKRVNELINGERFTPETAFHIETTLGLPDGFLDQPNPALSSDIINRLRAPLDFIRANAEPESAYEQRPEGTPAAQSQIISIDRPSRESDMSKRTEGGSLKAAAKSNRTSSRGDMVASTKPAPAKPKTTSKAATQQSLPLNDVATLENIRRANLQILTSRKGSKARLAAVIEMSDSNLANRLYGQKRMDDAEANRFTERLGLPAAWLDVPRSVTDVPKRVLDLLDPLSGQPASEHQRLPAAIDANEPVARKTAGKKRERATERPMQHVEPDYTEATTESESITGSQAPADANAHEPAIPVAQEPDIQRTIEATSAFPAAQQQVDSPAAAEVAAAPRIAASPTSLDDLIGIEPIAEALIKTLAGKARTGRLDEMKALELLQQIVSL
ncbi:hypothetical protein AAGS40_24755 (plasmid) [Paraburkholderia sp. PREW-6R]|uniref:hypothetical protein n=1 Tax=Paraburkholderia sp. PREW-6R TaxID=3141544 RepID=UPI0031F501F2